MGKAEVRRKRKLDFLKTKKEMEVGDIRDLPINLEEIKDIEDYPEYIERIFEDGLTGRVYKLDINGEKYTLKKEKDEIGVKNVDGLTSFLNEIQRREDFYSLKEKSPNKYNGIVDTIYASLNNGFIFSKWIEGIEPKKYTKNIIKSLFSVLWELEKVGIFEWDLCTGNLLVDNNENIKLYDFGYTYKFNPLKEYNSDGKELPIFHMAERFETRAFMQYLMNIEEKEGIKKVLDIYKMEKRLAIEIYNKKLNWLIKNNADKDIIEFYEDILKLWKKGIIKNKELKTIYCLESFRSYLLDVHDDISGKSCTPDTIKKINKVINICDEKYKFIKENDGFFFGDELLSKKELMKKYKKIKKEVKKYQIYK
ncbi:MAG: hypothetical protein ACQERZ_07495 [Fusobacteriota bacterium]